MLTRIFGLLPLSLFALTGCGVTVLSSPAEVVPEPTYAPSATYVHVSRPTYVASPADDRTRAPHYTAAAPAPYEPARTAPRVSPPARPAVRAMPTVRAATTVTDRPAGTTPGPRVVFNRGPRPTTATASTVQPAAPRAPERQGSKTMIDRPKATQSSTTSLQVRRPELRVPTRDRALPKRAEL